MTDTRFENVDGFADIQLNIMQCTCDVNVNLLLKRVLGTYSQRGSSAAIYQVKRLVYFHGYYVEG